MPRSPYHHGDLRATILTAAAAFGRQRGADAVSLRELARAAGVSHAAPAHHFTDRRGLFTALAAQGYTMLATAPSRPARLHRRRGGVRRLRDRQPRHYAVMFDRSPWTPTIRNWWRPKRPPPRN